MNAETEVHFTPREIEVIKLILLKYYRKKIGIQLHIAGGTVIITLRTCMQKQAASA
jgi:DNA-binding CsgD family transcriptional regulator